MDLDRNSGDRRRGRASRVAGNRAAAGRAGALWLWPVTFASLFVALGLAAALYPPAHNRASLSESLAQKGEAMAQLVAHGVRPALERGDERAVREVLAAAVRDPDVSHAGLLDGRDRFPMPSALAEPADRRPLWVGGAPGHPDEGLAVEVPIHGRGLGGDATLVIGLSRQRIERESRDDEIAWRTAGAGIALLGLAAGLGLLLLLRRIVRARDAEASGRARSEFLASMSHELRTPLNGVLGLARLLERTDLDFQQRDLLQSMKGSSRLLLDLVNDVLDYSRIEAGKLDIEATPICIPDMLEEVLDQFAAATAEKDLDLTCHIAADIPDRATGDPLRLRQVLGKLIGNAVEATARGAVAVQVDRHLADDGAARIRFRVEADCPPSDGSERARLLETFRRADASTSQRFGGREFGLAICHQIVARMGGELIETGEPNVGSSFEFTLPMLEEGPPATPVPPLAHAGASIIVACERPCLRQALVAQLATWGAEVTAIEKATHLPRVLGARLGTESRVPVVVFEGNRDELMVAQSAMLLSCDGAASLIWVAPFAERSQPADPLIPKVCRPVRLSALLEAVVGAAARGEAAALTFRSRSVRPNPQRPPRPPEARTDGSSPMAEDGIRTRARLLVAEDNPVNQTVMIGLLAHLGYVAECVTDGGAAIEAIAEDRDRYAGILMDCQMPEVNGFEATMVIRRMERERGAGRIPIIAVTAQASAGDDHDAHAAGMDGYLTKPIDETLLAAALAEHLPPEKASAEAKGLARGVARGLPPARVGAAPRRLTAAMYGPVGPSMMSDPAAPETGMLEPAAVQRLRLLESHGEGFLAEIAATYRADASRILASMTEAMVEGDFPALARLAHGLKGSSHTIGAGLVGEHCAAMECAAKSQNVDGVVSHLAAAQEAAQEAFLALDSLTAGNPSPGAEHGRTFPSVRDGTADPPS